MDPSITSIMSQFDPRMAALLGWVVVMVKTLVDWLRSATELPRWAPPMLAFLAALIGLLLLMLALGIPFSGQLAAQCVLAAMIAAILAVGQSAIQNRAQPSSVTVKAVADEIERRLRSDADEMAPHG